MNGGLKSKNMYYEVTSELINKSISFEIKPSRVRTKMCVFYSRTSSSCVLLFLFGLFSSCIRSDNVFQFSFI